MKGTQLAFRTPIGAQVIPGGATTNLTNAYPCGIPVSAYPTIRIGCVNRTSSGGPVTFLFTINLDRELTLNLDSVTLQPGASFTGTYDVPGIGLTIQASSPIGVSSSAVDVFVYGFVPYVETREHCDR